MQNCVQQVVFWPGITQDIKSIWKYLILLQAVLKNICRFFAVSWKQFFSSWRHFVRLVRNILHTQRKLSLKFASDIKFLRDLFSRFGVPEEVSSDGGPEFTFSATREFLKTWDVTHRIASTYYPRSNGRAELAVRQAKRLLRSNDPHQEAWTMISF